MDHNSPQDTQTLPEDPIVKALVPDPDAPPTDLAVLAGFLGRSTCHSRLRLYLSATLESFVDLEKESVVFRADLPREHSPLGGVAIWVRRNTICNVLARGPQDIIATMDAAPGVETAPGSMRQLDAATWQVEAGVMPESIPFLYAAGLILRAEAEA